MTKAKASTALKQLIDTNTVQLETVEWVERTEKAREGEMGVKGGLVLRHVTWGIPHREH